MPKVRKNLRTIRVEVPEEVNNFFPPPIDYPISKDELIELYYDQLLSIAEVAEQLGRGGTTIRRWMEKYKLPRRNYSEATTVHYQKMREKK